mgnify:CR=1 FL=1
MLARLAASDCGAKAAHRKIDQSVSQSVSHYQLLAGSSWPTRTLYSGLLFKCAAGISAIVLLLYLFCWQGLHFRMMSMVMCFLPFAFTYLLVGADLVERTSVMNQAPAGSCDPTRRGRSDAAGGTPQPHPPHVGRTTLHSARISDVPRTADTATVCQTLQANGPTPERGYRLRS